MTLWRPSDAPRTVKPVWQPTSGAAPAQPDLTDDEQARLAVYRDVYPHLEYVETRRQMNRLILERHIWRNGDNT
jgi:hypothetical protein